VSAPIPLSFTKLVVGDLERSAAYYEAVFGLGELYRVRGIRDPEMPGVELVGFLADPDGHVAEIVQPASAA
jgi:hypothetical protein